MYGNIYKITNQINNKVYIGKTLKSIEERFSEHIKDSTRSLEEKRPLYNAFKKYGINNFTISLIEKVEIEELSSREQYWIQKYDSYLNGYNATFGGDGKQLYDYQKIVQQYLSNKTVEELTKEFNCCKDTIYQALHLANIDLSNNIAKSCGKKLSAYDKDILIKSFSTRMEAVTWLQENKYTNSTNRDNINAAIGRAANGLRKTAYGFIWKNE